MRENTLLKQQLKDKDEKISKVIEYIKENTRYYDSEYSRIYSELCDCAWKWRHKTSRSC